MSQQPTQPHQPAHATDTPQSAGDQALPADPGTFATLTDERAVSMLRRWAEQAEADPAAHSYFPSVARTFFRVLAHEAERERRQQVHDANHRTSYDTQPVGVPSFASVTLAGEEVYDVFHAVLDAVQAWTTDEDVLPNNEAHRRLLRHLDALRTMTNAVIAADAPLVQAHLDDARAAEEWRHDRWMARGRRDREGGAARTASTTAQERQRGAEGSTDDADRDAGAVATPAPPANAGDARSA